MIATKIHSHTGSRLRIGEQRNKGPNLGHGHRIFQLTGHGATDKFTHYPLDRKGGMP
jgi:hypothetical protein